MRCYIGDSELSNGLYYDGNKNIPMTADQYASWCAFGIYDLTDNKILDYVYCKKNAAKGVSGGITGGYHTVTINTTHKIYLIMINPTAHVSPTDSMSRASNGFFIFNMRSDYIVPYKFQQFYSSSLIPDDFEDSDETRSFYTDTRLKCCNAILDYCKQIGDVPYTATALTDKLDAFNPFYSFEIDITKTANRIISFQNVYDYLKNPIQ